MEKITRRSIISTLAVTPLLAAPIAANAIERKQHPDAELLSLYDELLKQRAAAENAWAISDAADEAAKAEMPDYPICCCVKERNTGKVSRMSREQIENFMYIFSHGKHAEEYRKNVLAAYDDYFAELKAMNKKHNQNGLADIVEAEYQKCDALEIKIEKIQARTISGVCIKLEIWRRLQPTRPNDMDWPDLFVNGAMADLKRLGGVQ